MRARKSEMIHKTEAIVLAVRPFSGTSRMVVWLSRDYGKITTPVKGAARPKSFFLGQIDVAYKSELLFYARESGGMHNIRETTPLDFRTGLRECWPRAVSAGYLCHLTSFALEGGEPPQGIYDSLDHALSGLCNGLNPTDIILQYEIALLEALGFKPDFSRCAKCPFGDKRGRHCRFSISSGRLACLFSDPGIDEYASAAVGDDLHAGLERVMSGKPVAPLGNETVVGIRRILGFFICHHLEMPLYARQAAFSWLDASRN